MSRKEARILPPVPFDELHWAEFPDRFHNRTVRHLTRSLADISFSRFRHQMHVVSVASRVEMKVPLTDAELSQLFGQPEAGHKELFHDIYSISAQRNQLCAIPIRQ
jgi:hypothetical protein